ncbi:hypothetical protein EXN66_Car011963 [Channa argus]|uniref:Uncharacterized protein n=1 Tax=Channa argus TaxID=215402 RepID=A0A6G1Q252_CHAAH|nr:hypothetical protein EXN66_Car011963 [Channa argus]
MKHILHNFKIKFLQPSLQDFTVFCCDDHRLTSARKEGPVGISKRNSEYYVVALIA